MIRATLIFLALSVIQASGEDIKIENVERMVDASTQLARITERITIKNDGTSNINSYVYVADPYLKQNLAYVSAFSGTEELSVLNKTGESGNLAGESVYLIKIKSLPPTSTATVTVKSVFSRTFRAYPAEASQASPQLVLFDLNAYLFSPYPVVKTTTIVKLPSAKVESYSKKPAPASKTASDIKYGPFENLPGLSRERVQVHFENNSPFLAVKKLNRWIEVSHWGNVAVEEDLEVVHHGAKVVGEWSRLDYQRGQSSRAAVDGFTTVLPASSKDIYYRDAIGNVSTSRVRQLKNSVEIELRPRFPLFGGWRTEYTLGYNLPSYEYLMRRSTDYVLQMRFIDHVFDNQVIDKAVVKIVLPEGAESIEVHVPYNVVRLPNEIHYTYLDTKGRPVIVLEKENLVEEHIKDIQIKYYYKSSLLWLEPIYVVSVVMLITLLVIGFARLDFSLSSDKCRETSQKLAGYRDNMTQVVEIHSSIWKPFLSRLQKFRSTKDTNGLERVTLTASQDLKQVEADLADVIENAKIGLGENVGAVDKMSDVARLVRDINAQMLHLSNKTKGFMQGTVSKSDFANLDRTVGSAVSSSSDKLNSLMANL